MHVCESKRASSPACWRDGRAGQDMQDRAQRPGSFQRLADIDATTTSGRHRRDTCVVLGTITSVLLNDGGGGGRIFCVVLKRRVHGRLGEHNRLAMLIAPLQIAIPTEELHEACGLLPDKVLENLVIPVSFIYSSP